MCKNPREKALTRLASLIIAFWQRTGIDKRTSYTLATLSIAMLILKTSSVARLSLLLPRNITNKAKRKRAYRALSSDLSFKTIFSLLVEIALAIKGKMKFLPVIVDYTYLKDRKEKLLVAAVTYKGRTIPIAFEYVDFSLRGIKRNFELKFLEKVRKQIPQTLTVVFVMDREFSGKEFLKRLTEIEGVEVVVRLRKNAAIKDRVGKRVSLRYIRKSRGSCYYGEVEGSLYVKTGKDRVLIFSTLKELGLSKRLYVERMWIEEMFRDMKSQFGLGEMKVKDRKRKEALVAVMFCSYAALCFEDWKGRMKKDEYFSFVQNLLVKISLVGVILSDFTARRRWNVMP